MLLTEIDEILKEIEKENVMSFSILRELCVALACWLLTVDF